MKPEKNISLSPSSEFIVKDSVGALLFMAAAFSAMLFCAVRYNTDHGNIFIAAGAGLVPLLFVLYKLKNRKPAIVINRAGLFASGRRVTDWGHFVSAHFTQKHKRIISIKDDFVLMVEYRKEGYTGLFRITVPLTNTQNKSEEEVVAAVYYFFGQFKNGLI